MIESSEAARTIQTVLRAKAGDKSAFAELYTHYYKEMYRYAFYSLANASDAEDAVAETVASAYAQLSRLRAPEAFGAWIFRILSNQVRRRRKMYALDRSRFSPFEEAEHLEDRQSHASEEGMDLYRALQRLSEDERQVVILSVVDGYTSAEVGNILRLKPSTVRSKLSRALDKLERLLAYEEV